MQSRTLKHRKLTRIPFFDNYKYFVIIIHVLQHFSKPDCMPEG